MRVTFITLVSQFRLVLSPLCCNAGYLHRPGVAMQVTFITLLLQCGFHSSPSCCNAGYIRHPRVAMRVTSITPVVTCCSNHTALTPSHYSIVSVVWPLLHCTHGLTGHCNECRWTEGAEFGRAWMSVDEHGLVWMRMGEFEWAWVSVDNHNKCGWAWVSVDDYEWVWMSMGECW